MPIHHPSIHPFIHLNTTLCVPLYLRGDPQMIEGALPNNLCRFSSHRPSPPEDPLSMLNSDKTKEKEKR